MFARVLLTTAILLPAISSFGKDATDGVWDIKVLETSTKQFPWWRQVKYPVTLEVLTNREVFTIRIVDQSGGSCEVQPLEISTKQEFVFAFCYPTKHSGAWSPIHHAKLIDGKLHGVVTNKDYLFSWLGTSR